MTVTYPHDLYRTSIVLIYAAEPWLRQPRNWLMWRLNSMIALAPGFMRICCLSIFSFALMSPTIGLINGVGNTSLNLVISIMDGVVGRLVLSLWLGSGALVFFLGNTLACFITVIWGDFYYLSGRWENRTVLLTGEGSGGINH